jgi:hypothetical protein
VLLCKFFQQLLLPQIPCRLLSPLAFVWFFLKIEDNGAASLTHHLPADNEGNFVLALAYATGCMLVEAKSSSRQQKKICL